MASNNFDPGIDCFIPRIIKNQVFFLSFLIKINIYCKSKTFGVYVCCKQMTINGGNGVNRGL